MYCSCSIEISGTHWTALARLTRDFHPLRFSQVALFACDGSRPGRAASTLGLRLGEFIIILICGSWPQACHGLLCAQQLLPLYLLSHVGSWPAHLHTAILSGRISNVSSGPIQFLGLLPARRGPPGQWASAVWQHCLCRNMSQIETHFLGSGWAVQPDRRFQTLRIVLAAGGNWRSCPETFRLWAGKSDAYQLLSKKAHGRRDSSRF